MNQNNITGNMKYVVLSVILLLKLEKQVKII